MDVRQNRNLEVNRRRHENVQRRGVQSAISSGLTFFSYNCCGYRLRPFTSKCWSQTSSTGHCNSLSHIRNTQWSPNADPGQRGCRWRRASGRKCCRALLHPKMVRFFNEIKKNHPEFEVVLVSREYFLGHMGQWVVIQFGDPKIQELLAQHEVKTIPSMRMIKPNGDVVVLDARTEIQEK
ncbi:hypothetical protein CAEBREN_25484 [Caenorhabditis brenneri]|uniref:Uncharacterized protein n=1 Tax=Caenorhabditis brenneri TaxID=135651 RepID=G0NX05_CAEBE|nr:hypothetical protein CAEBREN_25484 [Caenorhabditis brenneri]